MRCPCKNCTAETGRELGCHARCKDYIDWKNERDAEAELIRKEKEFARVLRTPTQKKRWKDSHKIQKGDRLCES